MDPAAAIKARARELGFDACGIATAAPPATGPALERWLASGQHGAMAWLARTAPRRLDPRRVLDGARSLIAVAASYHRPDASLPAGVTANPTPDGPPLGVVARYARGADYHDFLGARLAELTRFVDGLATPAPQSRWYVDTGPLLERDLAQRAGLGFIGKHTNLIGGGLGNWVLLGEVLTTLELATDPPARNRCGTCTRCLAACPTQAITAPFTLDARRCIAYLTIELKGPIPEALRPAIGHRIFGCDDCLEACPWNRFAREGRLWRTYVRPDLATPDLLELLALDEAGFKARFAGTPVERAKRRGLRRNVCVALGNSGDVRGWPALEQAAADPDPLVAEHARWALARLDALRGPAPAPSPMP